jgi:site-specific DNA-methyltransferase (adenine-specific)
MEIRTGDCLDVLRTLPADSVDAIVTDPPYGLSFMGKRWDYDVPSVEVWAECLRVLKPGGHLLAFAGTRTQHRMAVRIEDAGFEIRDMIAWVYGSGFPKSLDVSKAIDKAAGAEREIVGVHPDAAKRTSGTVTASGWETPSRCNDITAPATEAARQWAGWGTALKPALEPITVARKPLIGTVAENVLAHGTGALNVDGCRVEGAPPSVPQPVFNSPTGRTYGMKTGEGRNGEMSQAAGRWPANLIHDGSEEVVGLFPQTAAAKSAERGERSGVNTNFGGSGGVRGHDDNGGSAARFFYCAKASKADRDEGCEGMEARITKAFEGGQIASAKTPEAMGGKRTTRNHHPTVKPTDLMRYLCRLVTPPGGTVLDPFMGSGSTGKAAMLEGFGFIGIERDPEYVKIAEARIGAAKDRAGLFG